MTATIITRAWLSFAVGFHQKASEVRDELIDLLGLMLPPLDDMPVCWVGSTRCSQCHGGGEVNAQIDLDAIGAQQVCYLAYLPQIGCGQHAWRGVDVVEYRTVDAYRSIGQRIVLDMRGIKVPIRMPTDTLTGITSFDSSVEIIPMVQQPVLESGN